MTITIEALDAHNQHDLNRCDNSFTVDAKLVLHAEQDLPRYTIVAVSPYQKQYPHTPVDLEQYPAQADKGIFFAYSDGHLAGQLMLSRHWNGYAYIDEITVDTSLRQQGIGRALIQQAIDWAKAKQLPGIMLETQNTNVGACRFYQRCGFELGGFDRYLYRASPPEREEIALYWYLFF